jgi:hypothetical protein
MEIDVIIPVDVEMILLVICIFVYSIYSFQGYLLFFFFFFTRIYGSHHVHVYLKFLL